MGLVSALEKQDPQTKAILISGLIGLITTPPGLNILTFALALNARQRSPQLPPVEDIINQSLELRRKGLEPRIGTDPFTGNVLISTADQQPFLAELTRNAAVRRAALDQDTSEIFEARQALIDGLAQSAQERGFPVAIDPSLRGGVLRPTADAPLQFVQGEFL